MTLSLSAPVVSVTVYPGQARITRRGTVTLPAGDSCEVVLGDLPLSLLHESVRVSGRGAGAIAGVDVRTEHHATDDTARVAALLAERQRLAVAAQELVDRRRALEVRVTMLESVATSAGRAYAKQLAAASLSTDDLGAVSYQLSEQLAIALAAKRALLDEEKHLTDEQQRVDRELGEGGGSTPDRTAVAVTVEPGDGGELELELSYLVSGASWEPRYDIKLVDDEVDVTWYGTVTQWSGEDWPECELKLSTARPTSAIQVPDLEPWFLAERQVYRPVPAAPRAMYAAAPAPGGPMDAIASGAARKRAEPVETYDAELEQGVTAATYAIRRPVAVAADGSGHQALITTFRLPAAVDYVTAPVRSEDVFLRATVTNTSEHTLRAGSASLFHDTEFVGASQLEVLAPGEKVELALGLDDRIRVERELVGRTAEKALLGLSGASRHEARWRTTVANHTGTQAKVTVVDQAPVSRSAGITVRDVRTTPEAEVDAVGEVTWTVDLRDGEQAELTLAVRVEVARGVDMVGWRD